MALKDIREVSVPLLLDRERTLKFDLNAFALLEERYGNMEAAFHSMQSGSMVAARTLLWVGLLHEDDALTERQVGGMVTLGNITEVMGTIERALLEAMPQTDAVDEDTGAANPTTPS